jgi:hypothetical protein
MSDVQQLLIVASVAGVLAGLALLVQGVIGYRRSTLVADVATSRIATLAVGEVRITGKVEAGEVTLVSPLQSRPCVYYRAIVTAHEGRSQRTLLRDERAVGFRVRDDSGAIRVFPRGASWDVPPMLHVSDGIGGDPPPDLDLRSGPTFDVPTTDRSALVARLLTVHGEPTALDGLGIGVSGGFGPSGRRYEEARIEIGDVVTIVGSALPFGDLADPLDASLGDVASGGPLAAAEDPAIAADLAAATAAGTLQTDPQQAWGNAAIEGFGIGRPVRPPVLDPDANPEPVVAPAADGSPAAIREAFAIRPEEAVLAVAPGRGMLVSLGAPATAVERGRSRFILGLLGGALAIASATVLVLGLDGGVGR